MLRWPLAMIERGERSLRRSWICRGCLARRRAKPLHARGRRRRGGNAPRGGIVGSCGPVGRPRPKPSPRPRYTVLEVDCPLLVARLGRSRAVSPPGTGGWTRWGAQVAGHPKRAVAMRQYARIKSRLPGGPRGTRGRAWSYAASLRAVVAPIHAVQFAAANQSEAKALCKRIAKSLAPCVVVKNG